MPKFCLASDLHLEYGSVIIDNTENADCLLLAGDVVGFCELKIKSDFLYSYIDEFFRNVSDQFKQVIWVPGNHEWYDYTFPNVASEYLESMGFGNIKIALNETIHVDHVPVHTTTLWTDFNRENPNVLFAASHEMNDYKFIQYKHATGIPVMLTPQYVLHDHKMAVQYLETALLDKSPCVVMTHHSPLMQTLSGTGSLMDYYYGSDLSNLILDNPHITNWCFGHTHNRVEYQIADTIVRSNCRGYNGHEPMTRTFYPVFFDV